MKNEVLIAIAAGLMIAFGVQTYMVFELNEKVKQLTPADNLAANQPKSIKPAFPKQPFDDGLLNGQAWNPYEEMRLMQDEMEKMFGDSFSRFHLNSPAGSYSKTPDLDLQEKPDSYVVTVNAPGAEESSLKVKLDEQVLRISIKTEHAEDSRDKNAGYKRRERFSGEFHRVLTLPGAVEADKMKTAYKNGVLTITIPKKAVEITL